MSSIIIKSINEYYEEFSKAKPYTRVKRGKLERVKGYSGKTGGSKKSVNVYFKDEQFNKIDLKEYKELSPKNKEDVLSFSINNYKEKYVLKQLQGKLAKNPTFKYLNGQIGMFEGKRRWALGEAEDYPKGSTDHRKWLHMAVAYQEQAAKVAAASPKWFGV
jgi:hypothetical protein